MSVIDTLKALAITVRNEKKREANSAIRIGDLFLAIIDFIKGLISGQIRQVGVDTYNDISEGKTSLLNKYPDPQIGWTVLVRKDEINNHKSILYQWNGSEWVDLETNIYNDDLAPKVNSKEENVVYSRDGKMDLQNYELINIGGPIWNTNQNLLASDTSFYSYENYVITDSIPTIAIRVKDDNSIINISGNILIANVIQDGDKFTLELKKLISFTEKSNGKGELFLFPDIDYVDDFAGCHVFIKVNDRRMLYNDITPTENLFTIGNIIGEGNIHKRYNILYSFIDIPENNSIIPLQRDVLDLKRSIMATPTTDLQELVNQTRDVRLGPGVWEISTTLSIPNNTKITGIRGATIIKLTGDATSIINFDATSKDISIDNITFQGKAPVTRTPLTPSDIKNRVGAGTDCGIYATGHAKNIHIRNCEFLDFSLAGIRLFRTHTGVYNRTFKITDCVFTASFYGLLSDVRSEYHTVTGCTFAYNTVGCFIAGGNNFMGVCHFEANSVGCVISGTLADNDSHGSIIGSSFNHNLNYSLCAIDINNGFTFSGCHCFDGNILLDNAKGFVFTGGEIACAIEQLNINTAINMIHSSLFFKTYGGGTITDKSKLSLMGNRFIDGSDSGSINN